jgi:hypothetical protein
MLVRVVAPLFVVLALTGPGFDGCAGSPPNGPVPPGTTVSCFADSDCPMMGCAQIGCVSGQCTTVAPLIDNDGDGHAPAPCGDDCDDTDAHVFPGAPERCNRRDDDCDGMIDEGAPPDANATPLGTTSPAIAIAAVGGSIVLTDTSLPGVRLQLADFQGRLGAPTSVVTTTVDAVDLAATTSGGVMAFESGQMIAAVPFTVTAGVLSVQPITPVVPAAASRLRVEGVGGSFVVVWDDPTQARFAMMPGWPTPAAIGTGIAVSVPLDVATDGASIAVPSDASTVAFLSPVNGAVTHHQTFPAALASDPLASGAHDYLVAFHDATDHQLAHMSEAALLATHASPSQGMGLPLRIDATPVGPLVTRLDATGITHMGVGAWALVLDDALDMVTRPLPPTTISPGVMGTPVGVGVASSSAGTVVLTNFGHAGSVLTVLACMPH